MTDLTTTQLRERLDDVLRANDVSGLHGCTYCGGATALLGRLIAQGTGYSLPHYARAVLAAPLGIDHYEWLTGVNGVASAASGLRLTPRDLARIGELVLAEGEWAAQRVVPADWIHTMLQPRLQTSWDAQYGYQWYIDRLHNCRLVAGMGNGGQRLYFLPERDLVVAITAGNYDDPDQWRTPLTVLHHVIAPAIG